MDGHDGGHVTGDGPEGPQAATVSGALAAFLAAAIGELAPDDPKLVSAALARTMAERIDRGDAGMAGMASQLRQIASDLGAEPGRPGDRFDAVLAVRQKRRLDSLLAQTEARAQQNAQEQP